MHQRLVAIGLLLVAGCPSSDGKLPPATAPGQPAHDAAPIAVTKPAAEARAVALTPDLAEPYFAKGSAAAAARAFALEDWTTARKGFVAFARHKDGPKTKVERARVTLMIALCDAALGAWPAAAKGFLAAGPDLPLLADFIEYQAARALYFAHDRAGARSHAAKVAATSTAGAEAELLLGDLLRDDGDWQKIADHYATYLHDRPTGMRLAEVRYDLAEADEHLGKEPEARALYQQIMVTAPLQAWADRASPRLEALIAKLPAADQAAARTLSADQLITRGKEYFDNMRNPESEADFAAALAAPGLTDDSRCVAAYHRAQSVFKQRDRTRAAPLFDDASLACAKTTNVDLQVKSAYQAGRSYANIGQHDLAVARYAAAEKAGPDHSYADDARLRQAEDEADLGHDAKVTELLSSLPKLYPKSDNVAEAMWRLGWRAYKATDYAQAIEWWKQQIALVPIDDNYYAEGQAQYWIGRGYGKLGKPADALASYEDTIKTYPMSYYALLALNRLREDAPERFAAITKEIATPPAGEDPKAPDFAFKPRALYGTAGFARALELLRLGLGREAQAELHALGLDPPGDKQRVTDPDKIDQLWALAYLFDRAGRYGDSHWMTRWHILDYKRSWPVGHNRARWRIAYPLAWWDLLDRHAKALGYPSELLIAFVREESAFDPLMESFANAIGLTQMIFPTAKRFAKGTGITVSREALRDPEKNVTIGSRFLGFLVDHFQRNIALLVPSYNAGEHATEKWLKLRGTWAADEFAEEIPYDETRNYAKRVITSYFDYAYLGDGTIPAMPNPIPPALIPGTVATPAERHDRRHIKGH